LIELNSQEQSFYPGEAMYGKSCITVVALIFTSAALANNVAKVTIDSGVLAGSSSTGVNSFKGVPFAKPPVGKLRWQPPEVPDRWPGERDATKYQLPCVQPTNADGKTPNGGGIWGKTSEDCLYLNVFAPANAKSAPVMVWLHGGASYLGGAHLGGYNGEAFSNQGVIIVTVNYRLGPLGYFAHPALTKAAKSDEGLGSYGLMDAVAALKWTQRNIAQFGGDPKNVTVFGQSAGGGMVMSLLSVPSAKGLFAKAGVQSGASLRPATSLADAEKAGVELATKLGLNGASATLEQLRSVPAEKFTDRDVGRAIASPVDGRFRTKATVDAFNDGSATYVPLLIGSNNGEGGFDGARKAADFMSAKAPAFLYQFAYVPEWRKPAQPQGAPHSAEIVYVFDSWNYSSSGDARVNDTDRKVAQRVNSCWVAFAKAATNTKSLSCADGFTWPSFTRTSDDAAVFAEKPSLTKSMSLKNGPPPGAPRGSMAPN
jgi:para-nitrobenzyl esterase